MGHDRRERRRKIQHHARRAGSTSRSTRTAKPPPRGRSAASPSQVVPVEIPAKKKGQPPTIFDRDESIREDATIEALRALKPAFKKDGTVTAGNAPGVNDAAAALVVMSAAKAKALGLKPLARIRAQATSGVDPKWVMMAPVNGVQKALARAGWTIDSVDLFELNEAFAVQAIAVTRELGVPLDKVNVNGGAVAIGHPIGASGARVLVTLIYEMIRRDVHRGRRRPLPRRRQLRRHVHRTRLAVHSKQLCHPERSAAIDLSSGRPS